MSYVAIARKWRPASFEDIAGQGHVTRTLQNAIQLGRIHHAFLFTGARGVGKTTAARVFARALNCVEGPTPRPCGACPSCVAIGAGSSPDVVEIDGASNNSVEDVRELRESVRYLPQNGRRKVYIVDEVHMLSRGAFNALLKTLEEPPEHVVFIFATTEPHKIPDTILSRVQRFDFKRMPVAVVTQRLKQVCEGEGIQIPDEALRLIARAGDGSMRDSQSLLDRVLAFTGREATVQQVADVLGLVDRGLLFGFLGGVLRNDADACLDAIDRVHSYGYDLGEFTGELLELVRNAAMVGLSPSSRRYLDIADDERQRLEALVDGVPSEVFVRAFQVLMDTHEQVARAERPRMVLEMAVARLVTIQPARPLDQIVQRLGDLERRLRQAGAGPRPGGGGGGSGGPAPRPGGPGASGLGGPREGGPDRPGGPRARVAAEPSPEPEPEGEAAPPPPDWLLQIPIPDEDEPTGLFGRAAHLALVDEPDPLAGDGVPGPELDEDDAAATQAGPAPLAAGAPPEARLDHLLSWLEAGGPRFYVIAWDTVLVSLNGGALVLGATSPFGANHSPALLQHPRVRLGLQAVFPEVTDVQLALRPPSCGALSRRERAEAERRARAEALRARVEADPLTHKLRELFGASLRDVGPADEPPPGLGRG